MCSLDQQNSRRPGVLLSRFGSRFQHDRRGTVSIIFGLTLIPVIAMVGVSVDYGRSVQARSKIQVAIDAAALAAARVWQTEQDVALATAAATHHWDAMKPTDVLASNLQFTIATAQSQVTLTATASIASPFLSMIGQPAIAVGATATAMLAIGGNGDQSLEIALMLDVTGSMCQPCSKIADLKTAAKDLVDIVVWDDQSEHTSKVAIAPFAARVNVGTKAAAFTGLPAIANGKKLRRCVTERSGAQAFTDAPPGPGAYMGPYQPGGTNYSNTASCDPSASEEIVPLTSNRATLKARIDALDTNGGTAGHLGTAWSWYMLSPAWSGIWPAASAPAAYNTPKLRKIAVLMTDGEYNTWYASTQGNSADQARQLCTNMKAQGIEIITVGFQLPNATAEATLQHCASGSENFYNATDGVGLKQAFRDIALRLAPLRLSN